MTIYWHTSLYAWTCKTKTTDLILLSQCVVELTASLDFELCVKVQYWCRVDK